MDIRKLEMLLAVVDHGGYVNAGEHLNISHSAIHRQIRLLEEEVGEKLLTRAGRNVQITEVGALLVDLARKLRRDISDVEKQIKDMKMLQGGTVRIGTGTTSLIFFLPPILEEFRSKYPAIELHIVTGTADQIIQEIKFGNLDFGIISEPLDDQDNDKNIRYERLYSEEFVVAVSKEHRLCRQKTIQLSDLATVPLISFTKGSRIRQMIDGLFERAGIWPTIAMEVENEEAIEKMIEISFGAGFLARRRASTDRIHYLELSDGPILLHIAAVHLGSYVPKRTREFLQICSRHAGTAPKPDLPKY